MRIGNALQPVVAKAIAPVVLANDVSLPLAPVPPQPDVLLAELSRLAYADLTTAEGWLRSEGFSDIRCFDRRSTQAIGCIRNAVRYLAFRGTQEKLDILVDANLLLFGSPPLVFAHATELKPSGNPRGLVFRPEVPKGPADILRETNKLPPPTNPLGSINDVVWTAVEAINPVLIALNHVRKQNPEDVWLIAEKTSLGKLSEFAAVSLFWICLLSALAIFSSADRLALVVSHWMPLIVFQWVAALAMQQVIYLALWSVPVWSRLLISVALASIAAWMTSDAEVSLSVVAGLATSFGAALLFLYRIISGLPDHFMKNYLDWLGARDTRKLVEDLQKQLDALRARDVVNLANNMQYLLKERATHGTAKPVDDWRK